MVAHTTLKGHSGAKLSIEIVDGQHVVRKEAADAARSDRLRAQAAKQEAAFQAGIPCPKVLARSERDDCFHFDMEYLPSISIAQTQIDSVPIDRDALLDFIEQNLERLAARTQGVIPVAQFEAKIDQVRQRCRASNLLSDLVPAIDRIMDALEGFDWSGIPASPCHGDFTLENILYNKERGFFLIDFDEVDISSFYLDAAKLFQDLWGHWCLRELSLGGAGQVALLNAMVNIDGLRASSLKRLGQRWPELPAKLLQMVILHLVRVLPYCSRQELAVLVVVRINQILVEADMHSESTERLPG